MALQQATANTNPDDVVPFKETHAKLPRYFRSAGGVDWIYRQHRMKFIEAGAVLEVGGRLFTVVPIFERVTLEIGKETLARRHAHASG
jgi:hypothetical protein